MSRGQVARESHRVSLGTCPEKWPGIVWMNVFGYANSIAVITRRREVGKTTMKVGKERVGDIY